MFSINHFPLTHQIAMSTTPRLFVLCLFCFALPLASAGEPATVSSQDRKAGERMTLTINDVEYAFRWCPPGTFMMGSPESELENERLRIDFEAQYQVTVSRGFWMLETQVTQAMWESVMGSNPSHFRGVRLPVETVSWDDSQEYIKVLNDLNVAPAGFKFSLPTEAQWEYACRAGTTTAFHFGDTLDAGKANFVVSSLRKTSVVDSYPANAWGLYGMHGNVREWCLDRQGNYPSGAVTDPTGVASDSHQYRVLRGGGWANVDSQCRSAHRSGYVPWGKGDSIGLRLVLVRAE